jgi:hypothetical protein
MKETFVISVFHHVTMSSTGKFQDKVATQFFAHSVAAL